MTPAPPVATANLAAAVFAEREGRILILKRAIGEMTGSWYVPGGAVESGESLEAGALRELREESGLVPTGPLHPVAHAILPVYGAESLQVFYAASCAEGDVVLDHEHSAFRWIEPEDYRARYFSDEVLERVQSADPRIGRIVSGVRDALERYLRWREREVALRRLGELRLSVDAFVRRGSEILILKRRGGLGSDRWVLPGGVVEPREDPTDAVLRETREQTRLELGDPRVLRVWTRPAQHGVDSIHATFVGRASPGDVRLSAEHSEYRWVDPGRWREDFWGERAEASAGAHAPFVRQVRRNLDLLLADSA
jgi:ADP-ribose pyrophosphatase YjhB (NUDIX family)